MDEKPTLLFVDDEERILRSLKMMFRNGYNVLTTNNGQEALHILRCKTIHVIVSDQRMPTMLGIEVLREAKNISPNTMRVLLTGYADLSAVIGSINEGEIFRYITKPWKSEDIRETISQASQIALDANEDTRIITPEKRLVMVLDEDPEVASFIQQLVAKDFGDQYYVEWATTFENTVEVLATEPVAVIVTELNLENKNTEDFIKSLKYHAPEIVTVATSSYQDIDILVGLINEGQVYRFLPKPLRRGVAAMALSGAFRHYQSLHERPYLIKRHKVVPPSPEKEAATSSITGRIMNLFRGNKS